MCLCELLSDVVDADLAAADVVDSDLAAADVVDADLAADVADGSSEGRNELWPGRSQMRTGSIKGPPRGFTLGLAEGLSDSVKKMTAGTVTSPPPPPPPSICSSSLEMVATDMSEF